MNITLNITVDRDSVDSILSILDNAEQDEYGTAKGRAATAWYHAIEAAVEAASEATTGATEHQDIHHHWTAGHNREA
jgi:hypothetical protein